MKVDTMWNSVVNAVTRRHASGGPSPHRERPRPTPLSYAERCRQAFGWDATPGNNCLFWSFPRSAPQTEQLYNAMFTIKCELFKQYLDLIRTESVAGAIVEFGVFDGRTLGHLADRSEDVGLCRPMYGFDSFEGLPAISAYDWQGWQAGQYAAPVDVVARFLKCESRPHVRLVKGWFAETLTSAAVLTDPALNQVAFAHVDSDLYQSAVECLRFLEGRLADGAFLLFDDWIPSDGHGEAKAFFEWYETARHRYRFEHLAALEKGSLHLRVWQR